MKRLLLGLVIAALLVVLIVGHVGVGPALAALADVSLPLLAAALLVQALILLIKARRWAVALRSARGRPVHGVVSASLIGFAGNLVLPARLGEIVRAHLVAKRNDLPRSLAMTTIAVTQFFDLLLLGLLFFIVSFLVTTDSLISRGLLAALLVVALTGLLMLLAIQRRSTNVAAAVEHALRFLPVRLRRATAYYAAQFASGLQLLGDRVAGGLVLLYTLAVWTLEVLSMSLALAAFGIPLNLLVSAVLVVALNLAFALPITPGNIGPHQFLSILVLGLFGIPDSRALAFSIGLQGSCSLLVLVLGGTALLRSGLGPRTLYREVTTTDTQSQSPTQEAVDHADRPVSRPEGPVPAARAGDSAGAAPGLRELRLCPRPER